MNGRGGCFCLLGQNSKPNIDGILNAGKMFDEMAKRAVENFRFIIIIIKKLNIKNGQPVRKIKAIELSREGN